MRVKSSVNITFENNLFLSEDKEFMRDGSYFPGAAQIEKAINIY